MAEREWPTTEDGERDEDFVEAHLEELDKRCVQLIQFIQQSGADISLDGLRFGTFATWLVNVGVLTRVQLNDFWLIWLESQENTLKQIVSDMREREEKMARIARQQQLLNGGIIVPGQNGFRRN